MPVTSSVHQLGSYNSSSEPAGICIWKSNLGSASESLTQKQVCVNVGGKGKNIQ